MPPIEPHPDDAAFLAEITDVAFEVARRLALPLREVEHKRRPHPGGTLGRCYSREGRVALVLRWRERGSWWQEPCHPMTVWGTLAHELAHLKEDGHDGAFRVWSGWCREALAAVLDERDIWPAAVESLRRIRHRSRMTERPDRP